MKRTRSKRLLTTSDERFRQCLDFQVKFKPLTAVHSNHDRHLKLRLTFVNGFRRCISFSALALECNMCCSDEAETLDPQLCTCWGLLERANIEAIIFGGDLGSITPVTRRASVGKSQNTFLRVYFPILPGCIP